MHAHILVHVPRETGDRDCNSVWKVHRTP